MGDLDDDDTVPQHLLDERGLPRTKNFTPGDVLFHLESRRLYLVLQMPSYAVIASSGEPCYCLREMSRDHSRPDPRWQIYTQSAADDGRFRLHARRVDT